MTVEYLVLGIILILMGGMQIWLRRGLASRSEKGDKAGQQEQGDGRAVRPPLGAGRVRSGRVWEAWTAILGYVGIAFGIALIVMGLLGR